MAVTLNAVLRNDLRKSVTKQLRQDGQLPAVVYGKGKEPKTIYVNQIDLIKTVRDEGRNAIISLNLDSGDSVQVMLHEYQMDPLKNDLIHADFYEVDLTEEMTVSVPVRIEGDVRGGILQQPLFDLQIKAKPHQIPEEITIDVSTLDIGDSVTVGELPKSDQFEYEDESDTTVVTVLAPETEDETPAEVDENAEPELVGAEEESDE